LASRFVASRRNSGKHAPHVGERLPHSWQWIVGLDLVLETHIAVVPYSLELPENLCDRNLSLAGNTLTLGNFEVTQIFGVSPAVAAAARSGQLLKCRNCPKGTLAGNGFADLNC
jgi:hypothetical protein